MKLMRTPFWLVFLALLGACTSGAPSTSSQAPAETTLVPAETAFHVTGQEASNPSQEPAPPTEEDAYRLYTYGDIEAAMKLYAQLLEQTIRARDEALHPQDPKVEANPAEAARLQAEMEWLAMGFVRAAGTSGNQSGARKFLDPLPLDPSMGLAWSLLQWGHPDRVANLHRLYDWQFLGPFDNERGAAMDHALPAQSDPISTSFPGKVRDVQWRHTPAQAPLGAHLNFSKLMHPTQQSALLLRTWVQAPTTTEATLLLGIEGEARVWHDGEPILDAPERRHMQIDSLAAPLTLHPGWNEISIKLGSRDHAPMLSARLVDAQAQPLAFPHTSTPPPEVLPQELKASPAPKVSIQDHPGALAYYYGLTLAAPENAEAFYRLGQLQDFYQTAPISQHPGRDALRKAVHLEPDNVRYRSLYASNLFPEAGTPAAEVDLNPWLEQARKVLALDPTNPTVLAQRAQAALQYQKLEPVALEHARSLVAACDAQPLTRFFLATILSGFSHNLVAENHFRALLADSRIAFYPNFREQALRQTLPEDSPQWLPALESIFEQDPRPDIQQEIMRKKRMLRAQFDADLELQELEQMLQLDPWNSGLLRASAERFQSQGDLDTAMRLVKRALAIKPESAANLALLARIYLAQGNLEEAVLSLERELDIDYSAEEESRLLQHLRALKGASFEEPYRESLDAIVARHPATNETNGKSPYSHEYLLYRTVIRIHPDSTAHRYMRKVIRVLNPNGMRKLDVVYFPYAYGDQELRVETAIVRHADGSEETARTARGWRGRQVDLPQLRVGDIIDLEWRVDDLHTTFFGKYFGLDHQMTPDRAVPTRESQLVLLVPDELPLVFHPLRLPDVKAEVAATENFGTSHAWTVYDLAPQRIETLMPPAEETVPRIQASSYASWEDFGAWWWNLIDSGIRLTPEMEAKVQELTANKTSLRDQVAAIYAFVANDIRYNAWEFGVHGYQPYSAPVIFSRKFGDCKDKAILLRAMLSAIGVEAYPVLLLRTADGHHGGRRFEEDLSLAMVSHFNHCIAYIPPQEDLPGMFVDGTASLHPLDVLPYDDRGAQVLIVKPTGVERVRIPFSDATDNTIHKSFLVHYQEDGSASVQMVIRPFGRFDAQYRSLFSGGDQDRQETVQRMLSSLFGPLADTPQYDIPVPDASRLGESLVYQLQGEPSSLARKAEGGLEIPFTLDPQGLLQTLAPEVTRNTDLLLDSAQVHEVVYEFSLPPGWTLDDIPETVEGSTQDASYRWQIELTEEGNFRVHEQFALLTHRIPVARYSAFRDLCRLVDSTQDRFLHASAPGNINQTEDQ